MKSQLLAIALILAQISGSGAEENPFIAGGVPASDRDWMGRDYATTFQALQAEKVPLPLLKEPAGKRIIERLTNEDNLRFHQNKSLPIDQRMGDALDILKINNSVLKLYMVKQGDGNEFHAETTMCVAFGIRAARVCWELIGEYIPTVPKDGDYEYRMQGMKKVRAGLMGIFANTEHLFDEKDVYSAQDFTILLQAMKSALPTLKEGLTAEYRQELEKKLTDRKAQFKGEDLAAVEEMLRALKADGKEASQAPALEGAKTDKER